ncbi:MAG: hypothetical protein HRU41_29430 [Saprospiraceae bacterium]|nr:hypothetical protein [Saprospiraceae bacterium]
MDNYNVLIEKRTGFVSFCDCCNTFQIVYGNLALVKSEQEFQKLIHTLSDIRRYYRLEGKDNHKTIWLDTSLSGVRFVFSYNEATEMQELAEEAYLIYKAEQLVNK